MEKLPAIFSTIAVLLMPLPFFTGTQATSAEEARIKWKLLYEETFDDPLVDDSTPWIRDIYGQESPWHVGPMDDDEEFFRIAGGEEFQKQLESFHTLRKRFAFGREGWLTAELAARDRDKDGIPDGAPSLSISTLDDGTTVAVIDEPDHHGGLLIRSTHALPAQYRIEYTLVKVNFGGSRYDRWEYGGKLNGYGLKGTKTRHPWLWSPSAELFKPHEDWLDVRFANGFYYLGIVDHPNPAPRNNVFIHTHRKVVIDSYNVVDDQAYFKTCNPATGEYYISHDNTLNMLFLTTIATKKQPETGVMTETECGIDESGRLEVFTAGQLVPELMPKKRYCFAIERDRSGYTLEVSGYFRFVGETTFRYHRDFIQNGRPIWHYNQRPDEYAGNFDTVMTYGDKLVHTWPAGSAYPDFFIIGDPHTNYYEGTAFIDDIRLYVPAE